MSGLPPSIQRVACYIRKSREDEEADRRGEDTLAKQREMLVSDVLSRYTFEYDLLEEVASGDSIAQRPVFRDLLPKLGHTYQAIVCKDLSRLGRGSYRDMGIVYDTVRLRRVFIITKDAVYDPRNFSDLRMIRFSLFFHREEYEMTLWRLTEGKYDGAARGQWVAGSVPYGYRYNAKTRSLEPDADESEVVRLIYTWRHNEHLGYRGIADRLTTLGYLTPRGKHTWHPEVVRRILNNPAYQGTLVFRKTERDPFTGQVLPRPAHEHIVVEHAFPPIVPDTHLPPDGSIGNGRSSGHAPPVSQKRSLSELGGLIRCSECSAKLVRQASTPVYRKADGSTSVYQKEFLYCPRCRYSVKYRDCEGQLRMAMNQLAFHPVALQHAAETLLQQEKHSLSASNARSVRAEASPRTLSGLPAKVSDQLKRARELLVEGILTKDEYLQYKSDCLKALDKEAQGEQGAEGCQATTAQSRRNPGPHGEISELLEHVSCWSELYDALSTTPAKNRLLRCLFEDVRLRRIEKRGGRGQPSRFELEIETKV